MNASAAASYAAPTSSRGSKRQDLDDAIHALAQPLTALSFVLDLACMRDDPAAWREALEVSRAECRRAVHAMEQVRSAALTDELIPAEPSGEGLEISW